MSHHYQADVIIVGAGLAGLTSALELLDSGKTILMLDGAPPEKFGGLANDAFGGMLLNGTKEQKRLGVKDSPELMLADWLRAAEFKPEHVWQKRWAEAYAEQSTEKVYHWLKQLGLSYFPVVNWVERGDFQPGNSVPRYHVAWGCGRGIVDILRAAIEGHRHAHKLSIKFLHRVHRIEQTGGKITGVSGTIQGQAFTASGDQLVIASGGFGGDLARVRKEWDPIYGPVPHNILNGCDPDTNGELHDRVSDLGGRVSNLGWMWNYAAGISNPKPQFDHHGLALIPPRSALWMDCYGRRIGPDPMMGAFDTHRLCKRLGHLDHQYGWLIMNWDIAIREIAVSGSDINANFRDKKFLKILWGLVTGSGKLMQWLIDECEDVLSANTLEQLAGQMDALVGSPRIDLQGMRADIARYDAMIAKGPLYHADDQLRRIAQARRWIGDRVRTARFQPIAGKGSKLIAIRTRLLSRKSMGGIETDLSSRVLSAAGKPIDNLYAVGECAGFGGGGIAGIRSLEGTFLSNCVFNGRAAARHIMGQ